MKTLTSMKEELKRLWKFMELHAALGTTSYLLDPEVKKLKIRYRELRDEIAEKEFQSNN